MTADIYRVRSGAELRAYRETQGWSQREMAARMGMEQPHISRAESAGELGPTLRARFALMRIIEKLGGSEKEAAQAIVKIAEEGLR